MTEDQTVAACLEWNKFNTPPLSKDKVRTTVADIAKSEAKKRGEKEMKNLRKGDSFAILIMIVLADYL